MRWNYVVLLASLAATRVAAQSMDSVRAGARVRVWEKAPSAELIARVRNTDVQAITLDAPAGLVTVPWTNVSHIEISAGPRSGPRWKSGLIGGLVGAMGGGLLGVIIGDASHHNAPKFGAAGIVVGGVAGAAIGTTRPGERWTPATRTDSRS
jgi:hypothetical protein